MRVFPQITLYINWEYNTIFKYNNFSIGHISDLLKKTYTRHQGVMCRTLQGHGHWVNSLALSTDYVMRTGAFDPADATIVHRDVTETS